MSWGWMSAAALIVALAGEADASGQSAPVGVHEPGDHRWLIEGLAATREQLRSGVCQIQGRRIENGERWGKFSAPVRLLVAFDHDRQFFRFDRREEQMMYDDTVNPDKNPAEASTENQPSQASESEPPEGVDNLGRHWKANPVGGKYVSTPDYDLFAPLGMAIVEQKAPGAVHGTTVKPFDIRFLGLAYWIDMERGADFAGILEAEQKRTATQVTRETDDLYCIISKEQHSSSELWIDVSKGYSPIRRVISRSRRGEMQEVSRIETSWIESGGTWVPETFRIDERSLPGATLGYELTFQWERVNQPVDKKYFTPEGLSDDDNARIIDDTSGTPVVRDKVRETQPDFMTQTSETKRVRYWLLIAANVLLAAVVVAAALFWPRRSQP